jgi:isopentenyl diphosphate isomerase/L-lactate dehydrogenase-like FMN-dependent dehydrogenase
MRKAVNIDDLRTAAKRRLPRLLFDYVDSGACSESTLRANIADFEDIFLEQRVLVDIGQRKLGASFLGAEHALPIILAPTGFAGLLARRGEVAAGRAAKAAGVPMCLSSAAICSMEEVVRDAGPDLYFQLYVFGNRSLIEGLIARAEAAGAGALFVTVDGTVGGRRERDLRNGFGAPDGPSLSARLDMLRHPAWGLDMLRGGPLEFGNLGGFGRGMAEQAAEVIRQLDPTLTWADLAAVRRRWTGRLVVKGILSVDDALRAADLGADAIVVSNHGGRQLDGARSAISVLPEIAAAVGERLEVLFDSGVRRGAHIIKALALGARACLIGRAYLYGLGAGGEAGVARALEILRLEIDTILAMMGVTDIDQLRQDGARYISRRES